LQVNRFTPVLHDKQSNPKPSSPPEQEMSSTNAEALLLAGATRSSQASDVPVAADVANVLLSAVESVALPPTQLATTGADPTTDPSADPAAGPAAGPVANTTTDTTPDTTSVGTTTPNELSNSSSLSNTSSSSSSSSSSSAPVSLVPTSSSTSTTSTTTTSSSLPSHPTRATFTSALSDTSDAKEPATEEVKRYRVDIHLCGKNHKFPGHYSLADKRIIHEWARVWKNNKMRQSIVDNRSVLCLRKNQQPQRWSQKDAFWWFHTKKVGAALAAQNALANGGMNFKQPRYVFLFLFLFLLFFFSRSVVTVAIPVQHHSFFF